MAYSVLGVCNQLEVASDLATAIMTRFSAEFVDLSDLSALGTDDFNLLLIDVSLCDRGNVEKLRTALIDVDRTIPKIFIIHGTRRADIIQAQSLGANEVLSYNFEDADLLAAISRQLKQRTMITLQKFPVRTSSAFQSIDALTSTMFAAVKSGRPLPKRGTEVCTRIITSALEENGVQAWLDIVRQHHSRTYRHSMSITGLTTAFGLHYGLKKEDISRLATSALLHDIGKARISASILDKTSGLTKQEQAHLQQHPVYGAEILRLDGQYSDETIDVAAHHHERLDGSGYPHGLAGHEISDLVRIIAIVNTFAELIDRRDYKTARTRTQAYEMLLDMGDKLDAELVAAFKPVALHQSPLELSYLRQVA